MLMRSGPEDPSTTSARPPRRRESASDCTNRLADSIISTSMATSTPKRPRHPARGGARARLIREAQRSLQANTFDAEALSAFAARAGMSQPLFHYHFESREDLWRAAVEDAFEPVQSVLKNGFGELKGLDPARRLELLVRRLVHFSAAQPVVAAVVVAETMRKGPRLEWLVENHLAPLHRVFDGALAEGVAQGALRPLDAVHVTQSLILAGAGFFACAPLTQALYAVDAQARVEAHADALVSIFLHGLLAEPRPRAGASRKRPQRRHRR